MRGGGGYNNEIEMSVFKRNLTINDFLIVREVSSNYFIIKYIGNVPYLFLSSNEGINLSKNPKYNGQYRIYYKFSIGSDCNLFYYGNGKITEYTIDESNSELFNDIGLFKLLIQHSVFYSNIKPDPSGTILDIIRIKYPEYQDIIRCLEILYSMYETYEKNKRNKNYMQYSRNRPPIEI